MKNRSITSLFKRGCSVILPLILMVSASQVKAAQYIVKLSSDSYVTAAKTDAAGFQKRMSALLQKDVSIIRPMSGESIVVNIDETIDNVRALASMPGVEYIEPDLRMYPTLVPNDPRYGEQWSLVASSVNAGAIDAETAWDTTTGTDAVVAVIDTGILKNHEEFQGGKLLPGYDFITDPATARDGDARDPDPSDEGDWQEAGDCGSPFPEDSSWHGSHVSGTAAATGDNAKGIAGVAFSPLTKILPLRVLGLCGGFLSDIADAIRWAAGLSVPGVPNNTTPAKVVNLSLGGFSPTCPQSFNDAFLDVYDKDVSVVVAAGNENSDASSFSPANCDRVLAVAAVDINGVRASYSNFGDVVDIAAPGGDMPNDTGILSAVDSGKTTPNGDSDYAFYQGTSMAAPHVAGIAALLYSEDATLSVDEVASILNQSARPFPVTGSAFDCTTSLCGSGLIDAAAAISLVNVNPNIEPTAEFTYRINGMRANFRDASTDSDGSIVLWAWNFGDGATSSVQNPSHTYAAAGEYIVTLTVSDNDGAISTANKKVRVPNVAPVAGITSSTTGLTTKFRDASSDSDGSIVSWLWNFGDNVTSSAQNPGHLYAAAGDYIVTLRVTDDDGATAKTSKLIVVPNKLPIAKFIFGANDREVDFSDGSTDRDGSIVRWSWNFGDGEKSTEQNPSHVYVATGNYMVSLTVRDNDGATNTVSKSVTLPNFSPTSGFNTRTTDFTTIFSDASTDSDGSIATWLWNFGDGDRSTEQNPTHVYATAGDYRVTLRVTDNDGASSDTSSKMVRVPNAAPTAGFTFNTADLTANFSDTSTDSDGSIVRWSWNFGDGARSSSQNPIHLYAAGGDYRVTLKVTDNDGATFTTSHSVTVNAPPTAGFTFSTTDLTANFRDTSTDSDGSIVRWSWNFGDGARSTAQNPTHVYATAGTYTVTLKVIDDDDALSDTSSKSVRVPNAAPTAGFTFSTTVLTTDFTDASSDSDGSIVRWSWNFGDNAISSEQNPSHTYAGAGDYMVTLTVKDNDGKTDTTSQSVIIQATAGFVFSTTGLTADFSDTSTVRYAPIVNWAWRFGDNASSSEQNPSHTYADAGDYTVKLEVTDSGGRIYSTSQTVTVTKPRSSSSGGGGSFPLITPLLLFAYLPIGFIRRRWFM
jgi:serine protease